MSRNPSKGKEEDAGKDVGNLAKGSPAPADGCPSWAQVLIEEIRALEIRLGNIRTTDSESGAWQEAKLGEVLSRLSDDSYSFDESVVEAHFRKISARLLADGFTAAQVAAFVNARIPTGGRLSYCNAQEVAEAASSAAPTDD